MQYIKAKPTISYADFYKLAHPINFLRSLTGKEYEVLSINENMMAFKRKSTGKQWTMGLIGVHQAYLKLIDFKTANFKPYVPRTHSPALGLLLHLGLLQKK
ncbi:hypothetical protein [Olivibacter sp. XZL3]|uniref:hypothetical protein n=1 Tax=Olivibacter sp. XZL3 TaxID=1735116 RepID=UPI001066FCB0|nr:hypothetical protein [Olivibacter sp. XZL3]